MSKSTSGNTQADPKSSKEARAKRVRSLRQMTRLSRREFADRYGVPASSLQNWEDASANGLSEKGARRIVKVLKAEGIICSVEWLMHGAGAGPQVTERLYLTATNTDISEEQLNVKEEKEKYFVIEELQLFRQHYPHTMDLIVNDDAMEPQFFKGDYVAGSCHSRNDLNKLIGVNCIVHTNDGEILLRKLRKGNFEGRYHLICLNSDTTIDKPILYDVEIINAAPVLWIRRERK